MISPKQRKILAFPYSKYDAIICDGAVRSGKTSIMMWAKKAAHIGRRTLAFVHIISKNSDNKVIKTSVLGL